MFQSDDDPAAKLTSSIGRALNIVALIVFPVGLVVCLIVLAFGDPAGADRVAFTAVLAALASAAALFAWRRRDRA